MSFDIFTGEELDERKEWMKEWEGMPAFQAAKDSEAEVGYIMVHFQTQEDVEAFSKAIGQKITISQSSRSKAIWYPKKETPQTIERFF